MLNTAAPYRRDERATLRVPVVMPLVEVTVDEDGSLAMLLDREPYAADGALHRDDLKPLLDDIAADLGTPLRVEVQEADNSTFTDIVTPPRRTTTAPSDPARPTSPSPAPRGVQRPRTALASSFGIAGDGFSPGEDISVCVVVARQVADGEGTTQLRLPPALLAAHPGVVLVGRSSGTIAHSEGAA